MGQCKTLIWKTAFQYLKIRWPGPVDHGTSVLVSTTQCYIRRVYNKLSHQINPAPMSFSILPVSSCLNTSCTSASNDYMGFGRKPIFRDIEYID